MALEVGIGSNNPRSHGRHSFSFLDGGRWMDGLSQPFCIASKASTDHLAFAIAIVPLPYLPPIDRATEVFKSEISRNELRELCNIMSDPPSTS